MTKALCDKMLADTNISYEKLQVEQYVTKIPEYWSEQENQKVFKLDSVSFLYLWGSFFVWGAITVLCLLVSNCLMESCRRRFRYSGAGAQSFLWQTGRLFLSFPLCVS